MDIANNHLNLPEVHTERAYYTEENIDTGVDLSESPSVSPSPCPSPCHVHRQHRSRIYDVSDDDLDAEDDPPFEARTVSINRDRRVDTFYDLMEVLGKGKFGMVYKCKEKSTGRDFAAKFIEIKRPSERKEVENEIEIMVELQHPRLLQLYDAYDDGSKMAIIMELASGGELFSRVIDDEFVLTEKICTVFMRQICEGVEFMHNKSIVHLDMKPENILCVTRTGNRIKLIDFGLARKFRPKDHIQVMFGTPEFVAPEVISYDRITFSTDMWSVGVICYILISGLSPFMGDSDAETLINVTEAAWDFDDACFDTISEDAKDFISRLLVKRPDKRMTATQCLQHRWLQTHAPFEANMESKKEFKERRRSLAENEISKAKLRRFVIRRRWQKIFNTIRALRRMGSNLMALAESAVILDGELLPEENDLNCDSSCADQEVPERSSAASEILSEDLNSVALIIKDVVMGDMPGDHLQAAEQEAADSETADDVTDDLECISRD